MKMRLPCFGSRYVFVCFHIGLTLHRLSVAIHTLNVHPQLILDAFLFRKRNGKILTTKRGTTPSANSIHLPNHPMIPRPQEVRHDVTMLRSASDAL